MTRLTFLIRVGSILTALLGAGVAILTSGLGNGGASKPPRDDEGES